MDKKHTIDQIAHTLKGQLGILNKEVESLKEELSNETKSSAGDKFETTREMMAQEMRRLKDQMQYKMELIHDLEQIPLIPKRQIEYGALVQLNDIFVLIGIGAGNFMVNEKKITCLSISSPLGQLLLGKQVDQSISFNNNTFTIQSIA